MFRPLLRATLSQACGLLFTPLLLHAQTYYGARSPEDSPATVEVIDITTGESLNSITAELGGSTFDGFTGMAFHPGDGQVYVIAKDGGTFTLATMDLGNGVLTALATLPDKFAGISWGNGILYGITGDGAADPEELFIIDPDDGSADFLVAPGMGVDGEALAFNSIDGLLYRYGGGDVFQAINPTTLAITNIDLPYQLENFGHAMVHDPANNTFLLAAGDTLYRVTPAGQLTNLATFSGNIQNNGLKGLMSTTVTGIGPQQEALPMDVFPIPADDQLTIHTQGIGKGGLIQVYDADGSLVDERSIASVGVLTYATDGLANGTYTLLLTDGGQRRTKQFVVQH